MSTEENPATTEATQDPSLIFGAKKKRRTKKKEDTDEAKETEEDKTVTQTEEKVAAKETEQDKEPETESLNNPNTVDAKEARTKIMSNFPNFVERDYSYEELVSRLFSMNQKPEEKTTVKIKPPIVHKEGTTRTAWTNFPQICQSINRQPDHVIQFVLAEVACTGSVDGNGRLLIKGRFQQKHIERILRHYIVEYVQCHTCKSLETKLQKENRLLFMKCDTCGSTRSVAQIKTGFQATTRASRRTQQNAKT
eukprot:TRINITY_DN25029_c0_g1_i1.p1 TRINITY_DN25029_c0_g1~~TRINITY_DN25029_c0_g1_i1.p1  ORF type:complete len:277 (-),score=57.31 TRINITY_DN25029_c0_g1_i1:57-809(-)